jgi:hypothetical protein
MNMIPNLSMVLPTNPANISREIRDAQRRLQWFTIRRSFVMDNPSQATAYEFDFLDTKINDMVEFIRKCQDMKVGS